MTKHFLISSFLFFCMTSNGQTKSSYIEKDTTFYCKIYSDGANSVIKECYSLKDSSLLHIESYVNKKLTGIRNQYYQNGSLLRQEEFLNGKNVGQFLEFNINGTICISGSFAEGASDDLLREYCGEDEFVSIDNPGVMTRHYCFSSPREGKWTYYADNGKKYCEGYYKNNKRIGKWIFYNINNEKIKNQKDYGNGEK